MSLVALLSLRAALSGVSGFVPWGLNGHQSLIRPILTRLCPRTRTSSCTQIPALAGAGCSCASTFLGLATDRRNVALHGTLQDPLGAECITRSKWWLQTRSNVKGISAAPMARTRGWIKTLPTQ